MSVREDSKRLSARDVAERLDRVVDSTNEAIKSTDLKIENIDAKLDALMRAINNPVFRAVKEETAETQEHTAEYNERTGKIDQPEPDDSAVIEFAAFDAKNPDQAAKAKLDMLAFMNESVSIHIMETSEQQADQVFEVAVNGKGMVMRRGGDYTLPRYYVETLARARPVHYKNQEYQDQEGVKRVRWPAKRGERYPFSVTEDTAKGREWLKRLRAS